MSDKSPAQRIAFDPHHYIATLVLLTRHPQRWALLMENVSGSTIVRLRDRWSVFGFHFVARGSNANGRSEKVYVIYLGLEENSPFPVPNWEEPPPLSHQPIDTRKLLEYARTHPTVGVAEIARSLDLNVSSVRRHLKRADLLDSRTKTR